MDAEPRGGTPYIRPAFAITELLNEVNAAYPGRSKTADGIVGDYAHSTRSSGHNPNSKGIVCALDITHDPKRCPGNEIAEALRSSRDPRLLYVIWNRRIFDGAEGDKPWTWHAYTGADPHTGHVHVSLRQTARYYDDRSPWAIGDDDMADVMVPTSDNNPHHKPGTELPLGKYLQELSHEIFAIREVVQKDIVVDRHDDAQDAKP